MIMPRHRSKEKYFNYYENNFCMHPDGKTFFGRKNNILKSQDITRKEIKVIIDQKRSPISTMIFNLNLNSLLVGGYNGRLSQYGRNHFGDLKKLKDYGNVGVGRIFAIDLSENFVVVGGKNGKISLIDMKKRELIRKGIKTGIRSIYSLQFCRVSQNEMHLAVGGETKNYSFSKTDLFDVSKLFNLEGNKGENVKTTKKKLIEKVKSMSE